MGDVAGKIILVLWRRRESKLKRESTKPKRDATLADKSARVAGKLETDGDESRRSDRDRAAR